MKRRIWLALLAGVAALSGATGTARAQADFPNHPIRIIVPQAAGSGIDIHARLLANKMGELCGHQGIVENRPGANAMLGVDAVAKAAPDG
jgi:tripartite-type tricarboxylate transporter receptor subunit TctC